MNIIFLTVLYAIIISEYVCRRHMEVAEEVEFALGRIMKAQVSKNTWKQILEENKRHSIIDIFKAKPKQHKIELEGVVTKRGERVLKRLGLNYTVKTHYSARKSASEPSLLPDTSKPGIIGNLITFNRVLLYGEIEPYVKGLQQFSTNYRKVSVEIIGKSHEHRDIRLVKIEHPNAKHVMFFDAGIHAREWLSVMTALYLIQKLILSPEDDPISHLNWYIVPLLNPDGFIYSQQKYPFQRKNRNFKNCTRDCKHCGVDLNRNFPFKWEASDDPCDQVYSGESPLSEPETQALSNALKKYLKNIKLYIALHSYMCSFLYPWGYTDRPVKDYKDLEYVANYSCELMNRFPQRSCIYDIQNAGSIAAGAGGADDYAKGELHIKYVFTFEMQGGGYTGFHPYDNETRPFVEQNYIGIKALCLKILDTISDEAKRRTLELESDKSVSRSVNIQGPNEKSGINNIPYFNVYLYLLLCILLI